MTAREIVRALGLAERTDSYTDRPHADLWSGSGVLPSLSSIGEGAEKLRRALSNAAEVEEWGDEPYRVVWRLVDERAHVTYCEGDVSVLIARSDEDFAAIEASARRFYERGSAA